VAAASTALRKTGLIRASLQRLPAPARPRSPPWPGERVRCMASLDVWQSCLSHPRLPAGCACSAGGHVHAAACYRLATPTETWPRYGVVKHRFASGFDVRCCPPLCWLIVLLMRVLCRMQAVALPHIHRTSLSRRLAQFPKVRRVTNVSIIEPVRQAFSPGMYHTTPRQERVWCVCARVQDVRMRGVMRAHARLRAPSGPHIARRAQLRVPHPCRPTQDGVEPQGRPPQLAVR
jgi:hypothetical protein